MVVAKVHSGLHPLDLSKSTVVLTGLSPSTRLRRLALYEPLRRLKAC